ncbi:coil containing protein [Vibrio phage vB_VviC_ZQ26]|nr:coil containing protein [Vibrio phage vB_VviC_ZQ26]
MSPSLQTMGFFMSEINFCNTKEQLNHLGEVVTGKVDGSPSGADIDTSTLPYTGQVRKTLPALEGEYEQSITTKESEADAAIDEYRLTNKGPYAAGITLESKFEYITYNGESYFATNPPYTTTAITPDSDGNLFAGGYTTIETVANKIGNPNLLSNSNFLTPSPEDITHPSATPTTYTAGTQIFSGVYAGSSGVTVTLINGRVNCSAGSYEYRVSNTNGLEHVPVFTSSVSDYNGNPVTTGVSHALVSDEHVVIVTPAAGDVFSVKFEEGDIATRHGLDFPNSHTLEYFGVSQLSTPQNNAKALIRSVAILGKAITSGGPYVFDFDGIDILPISHSNVVFDLGLERHVIRNYSGINPTEATHATVNIVADCDDTWFSHFFRFEKIEVFSSSIIDIKNVQLDLTNNEAWFARVNQGNDVETTFNLGIVKTTNWKGFDDKPTTLSVMSLFGQFHSGLPKLKAHTYNIGVCYVDEWYTIDSNTGDISDGESDWFRAFTNPHYINIGVLVTKNFAKRFVKSQNETHITVGTMLSTLDDRFIGSVNHIATFDMQILNGSGNEPSSLTVNNLHIDYELSSGNPIFFAATSSGAHSLTINNGTYNKFAVAGSGPVEISVDNFKGASTFINTPDSALVKFTNYIDESPVDYRCPNLSMENCTLYGQAVNANSIFDVAPASLTNVTFEDWDIGRKIGLIQHMDNVTFNFTSGTLDNRPVAPSEGENFYSNVTVNNTSGTPCILLFRSSAVTGTVNITNAKLGQDMNLAFMTSGSWDFVLNNCDNETITGTAVNSKVKAEYVSF